MTTTTWVILGGSSAVAAAFARIAAEQGCPLVLAGRDTTHLEVSAADLGLRGAPLVRVLDFDALDFDNHGRFVSQCLENTDGPVAVFLCFGLMPEQHRMQAEFSLARTCIDTNFTAAASVLEAFAAAYEGGRKGAVVVVSSVAGDRGRAKNYLYGAAKAGLSTYAEGLRGRLFASGISVTLVKPGFLDTAMTWGLPGIKGAASPRSCAAACFKAAAAGTENLYFPWPWRWIMAILKAIPARWFKRLKI